MMPNQQLASKVTPALEQRPNDLWVFIDRTFERTKPLRDIPYMSENPCCFVHLMGRIKMPAPRAESKRTSRSR
jgi:hypothetical protein